VHRFDVDDVRRRYQALGLLDDDPSAGDSFAGAERVLAGELPMYGWNWVRRDSTTSWTTNPSTGYRYPPVHWTLIDDHLPEVGDIKDVWELSRMRHTFVLARAWVRSGDDRYAECWWELLESWLDANPPNTGANWRCAQESSLRAMAVTFGLSTFGNHPSSTPHRIDRAQRLLGATADRVEPTLGYALSQRNNHAISELSFLLSLPGRADLRAAAMLQEVLRDQFLPDGSYSQQSVVYERLAVHVLAWLLEVQPALPRDLRRDIVVALQRAGQFLERCADPVSGAWANTGHNDGALFLDLALSDHLDARPTLALLGLEVTDRAANEPTCWLQPVPASDADSTATDVSTYRTLRGPRSLLATRVGRGAHRAAHDDQQAVELFLDGVRAVIDPGTFRYTAPAPWGNPFVGAAMHSTVRVSQPAEQVHLGRFLHEAMPAALLVTHHRYADGEVLVSDRRELGTTLTRSLVRVGDRYAVVDHTVGGPAIVRWNLATDRTRWTAEVPDTSGAEPRSASDPASGWWSPSYAQQEPCEAVEVHLADGQRTTARFSPKGQPVLTDREIDAALTAPPIDVATRTVLVLNHFAQPLSAPGGTRHVELFSRIPGWSARVITSNRNMLTGKLVETDGVLETVWTSRYRGNGIGRIVNWSTYALTAFSRGVRVRRVDIVYGSSPHLLAALAAWGIAFVRRKPFVLEIRDVWPKVLSDMRTLAADSLLYRALEHLETFLYRRASRIVVLAEGVRTHIQQRGVPTERIVYIPNGADPTDMTSNRDRNDLRREYGFDGVVAVYAGAHGPANGLDLLLDAAAAAATEAPQLRVVLVGDGAEKDRLVRRAATEGIPNVRFLDPIPKSRMADLLSAADIGVHCLADVDLFRTGVSPNKLFDYMAAGRAVITNTPGLCSDYVLAARGGLAVEPIGLAAGLVQLAALDPAERELLGAHARAYIAATQSRTTMAARLTDLLNEVLSGR
jgi:glycosyltransferase involved in cell wall biosynthesis